MSTRILLHTSAIPLAVLGAIVTAGYWLPAVQSMEFSGGSTEQLLNSTGVGWLFLHGVIVSSFIVLQIVKSARNFDAKSLETNIQSSLVFLALVSTAWTMFPVFQNNMLGLPDAGDLISPYLAKLYAKLIVTFGSLLLCYCAGLIQEFWTKSVDMFGRLGSSVQFAMTLVIVYLAASSLIWFSDLPRKAERNPEPVEIVSENQANSETEVGQTQSSDTEEIQLPEFNPPVESQNSDIQNVVAEFEERVKVDTQKIDEALTESLTKFELPDNVYFDFNTHDTRDLYPAFLYQQGNKFLVENQWIIMQSVEADDLLKRYPQRPVISLSNNRQLLLNTQVLNTLIQWLNENSSFFDVSQEIRFLLKKSDSQIQLVTPKSSKHPSQTLLIN